MNIRNIFLAGVAAFGFTIGTANATVITGPYVNLGGTADLTQTQHSTSFGRSSQVGHAPGWGGNAAFGWGLGNGFRLEGEGLYLQSHVNRVSPLDAHGHNQTYGGMFNVLYDIDLKRNFGIDSFVTPYVGVGAGYLVDSYNVHGPVRNITGTQGTFGYQGIVGASFDTGVPGLSTFVDYRMIGETMGRDSYHDDDSHFDHKFNHTFNVGLRYAFNTPAVVHVSSVIPAPAPVQARSYIVFFDWDRFDLTAEAIKVVDAAAQAAPHVNTTRIEVNGYTDNTSIHGGVRGEHFNQDLSVRRANSVAAELIKQGVAKDEIMIHGFGETHPLVNVGPQTREAQNRRVEIIIK